MPPKASVFDLGVQEARVHHPSCVLLAPSEGPSDLVPPRKALLLSGPVKTSKFTLQGLTSHKHHVK
jgi:hypothetical protein